MLLVIEGPGGSGKSTVRDRLLDAVLASGSNIHHVGQFSWLSPAATRIIVSLRRGEAIVDARQAIDAMGQDLQHHGRYNIACAVASGPVVADRLLLSSACLLALVYGGDIADYIDQLLPHCPLPPDHTVLLTTPVTVCNQRLTTRTTPPRFGDQPDNTQRLHLLYQQAAQAWATQTGLSVFQHPCVDAADLDTIAAFCLDKLPAAYARSGEGAQV